MRAAPPGSPIDSPRGPGGTRIHYATDGRDILFNQPDGWEVDQPWLWWTDGDGTFGNPPPGADGSGFLTSLPAVSRCTSIICDTIGGLPWDIFRGYEKLPDPPWIQDPQALRPDARIVDPATLLEVRLSRGGVLDAVDHRRPLVRRRLPLRPGAR